MKNREVTHTHCCRYKLNTVLQYQLVLFRTALDYELYTLQYHILQRQIHERMMTKIEPQDSLGKIQGHFELRHYTVGIENTEKGKKMVNALIRFRKDS